MAIGQAGQITTSSPTENQPITVSFAETLDNPVVVLTGTNNGGNQYSARVIEITDDSFTFIIEEWEYHDGPHGATETIHWLAVEEGTHTLPDGRQITAGTASANHTDTAVSLTGFDDPPVVLTNVISNNDAIAVDSDPHNIMATGFDIRLQEEQAQDGIHGFEDVGYIAIEAGNGTDSGSAITHGNFDESTVDYALGATFTNATVLAETQTLNDTDTANIEIRGGPDSNSVFLRLREEQSADRETNHQDETLGLVAFETGLILCFTPDTLITTPLGPVDIKSLKAGDLIITKDNGLQPIRWIGSKRVSYLRQMVDPHLQPVTIPAHFFGAGVPSRPLKVSPQHRILVSGYEMQLNYGESEVFVAAKSLLTHAHIPSPKPEETEYIHIMFDTHQVIYANGVETESLHPGHLTKDGLDGKARDELFAIFPELRSSPESYGKAARMVIKTELAKATLNLLPTINLDDPPQMRPHLLF